MNNNQGGGGQEKWTWTGEEGGKWRGESCPVPTRKGDLATGLNRAYNSVWDNAQDGNLKIMVG